MQIEYLKYIFIIVILSNAKQRSLKDQLQKANSKSRNDCPAIENVNRAEIEMVIDEVEK